ncbi:hypothetical protein SAMN05428954_5996 [Streptomyces sp. 2112.3]|nr:hypothetical protein SAMN05428954_5996 [Streptomyces sp. 2112.3]
MRAAAPPAKARQCPGLQGPHRERKSRQPPFSRPSQGGGADKCVFQKDACPDKSSGIRRYPVYELSPADMFHVLRRTYASTQLEAGEAIVSVCRSPCTPLPRCWRGWSTRGGWAGSPGRASTRTEGHDGTAKQRCSGVSSFWNSADGRPAPGGSRHLRRACDPSKPQKRPAARRVRQPRRPDGLPYLLPRSRGDADDLRDDLQAYLAEQLGEANGVLVVDDTGFVKKGPSPLPATAGPAAPPAFPASATLPSRATLPAP